MSGSSFSVFAGFACTLGAGAAFFSGFAFFASAFAGFGCFAAGFSAGSAAAAFGFLPRPGGSRALLDARGIRLVAPGCAGANVAGPSWAGPSGPAVDGAQRAGRDGDERPFVVIDAGGDDAGATALGRFARTVEQAPYEMLYVVNRNRNLTQEPAEAVEVLREIEAKSHWRATCVVNNTHLQHDTDAQVVEQGLPFAQAVAQAAGLPLACTTVPAAAARPAAGRETTPPAPHGDGQTH